MRGELITPHQLVQRNDPLLTQAPREKLAVAHWQGKTFTDYLRFCQDTGRLAYGRAIFQLASLGTNLGYRLVSSDLGKQAHYVACLLSGTSDALAEMFALGVPPMSNTDREFLEGHANGNQFEANPKLGDYYAGVARAGGVDPKGKVYLSSLAAYPGDPKAWVSGRGDVQKVVEERGWGCRGAVNVKMREVPNPLDQPYKVAEDIVEDRALDLMEAGVVEKPQDAVEKAREQLSPDW